MGERLREVAEQAACLRVVLLGEQADVVADRQQALEDPRASSWRPISARLSASQNVQGRKAPSPGGSPSTSGVVGLVPPDEAVRASASLLDRLDRARRPGGSVGGRKPTSGIISRLASSRFEPYDWTNASSSGRTRCADLGVDLVAEAASARPAPRSRTRSTALTAAVEGDPGHHLRVSEVPPRPADLPDALVGLAARRLRGTEQGTASRQASSLGGRGRARRLVQRVEDLAVDVELELLQAALPIRTGFDPS